jgi:hypothetical protein
MLVRARGRSGRALHVLSLARSLPLIAGPRFRGRDEHENIRAREAGIGERTVVEAQDFIAMRNRVGPPLRLAVLRENLRTFAHCDVFVEGLGKAGIAE